MKDHFQIRIQDYVFLEGGGFCEGNGDRLRSTAGGGGFSRGTWERSSPETDGVIALLKLFQPQRCGNLKI